MASLFQNKEELRKWAKSFDKNVYSKQLVSLLRQNEFYKKAKNIMIFYPLKNEVNLLSLLEDGDKKFYLPKIDGQNLLCCPYSKDSKTSFSKYKTIEPLTKPIDKNLIDLVIVPALCCDKNNCRLGYGGGYYDRFLHDYRGKTITCLPKELIVNTVYQETHDISVDLVITCQSYS